MEKTKFVVFSVYFGRLPEYFYHWLVSCSFNHAFRFILFTDDQRNFNCPDNVRIYKMSLPEMNERISSKFHKKIIISNPYKLCDFKPFYGFIFDDYLDGCDYWGYCDIDLVFGDLASFLPDNYDKYDKIGNLGHFCLIKNTPTHISFFRLPKKLSVSLPDLLASDVHFGIDEIGDYGVNSIFLQNGLTIYPYEKYVADITSFYKCLVLSHYNAGRFLHEKGERVFLFERGSVFGITASSNGLIKQAYAYVHFQKRKMSNNVLDDEERFMICYNSFQQAVEVDIAYIKKHQPRYKRKRYIWLIIRRFKGLSARIKRNKVLRFLKNGKNA